MNRDTFQLLALLSAMLLLATAALTAVSFRDGLETLIHFGGQPYHLWLIDGRVGIDNLPAVRSDLQRLYSVNRGPVFVRKSWSSSSYCPLPLAAFVLMPFKALLDLRQAWARPAGACEGCGYDLRASADRCPECGKPIGPRRGNIRPMNLSGSSDLVSHRTDLDTAATVTPSGVPVAVPDAASQGLDYVLQWSYCMLAVFTR